MPHSPVFVGIGHYASSMPLAVAVVPFKAIPVRPRVDASPVLLAVDPVSFKSAQPVTYNPKRPQHNTRKTPSVSVPPPCTHALTQPPPRTNSSCPLPCAAQARVHAPPSHTPRHARRTHPHPSGQVELPRPCLVPLSHSPSYVLMSPWTTTSSESSASAGIGSGDRGLCSETGNTLC